MQEQGEQSVHVVCLSSTPISDTEMWRRLRKDLRLNMINIKRIIQGKY